MKISDKSSVTRARPASAPKPAPRATPAAAQKDGFSGTASKFPAKFGSTPPDPGLVKKLIDGFVNGVIAGTLKTQVSQLSPAQIKTLQGVYGQNVDFSNVRLVKMPPELEKALMIASGGQPARAFTVGDMILLPAADYKAVTSGQNDQLLVHEAAHVLQYRQMGAGVPIDSLTNQGKDGAATYKWEDDLAKGASWSQLNVEAQAHLIDQAYGEGFFKDPGNRMFVAPDGKSHVVVKPGETPPDGYLDVTRVVRDGVGQLRGEPPLPGPDLPPDDGIRLA